MSHQRSFFLLFICLFLPLKKTLAQSCVADYFFKTYKGDYSQKISGTIVTPRQEIITIGSVFYPQNNMYFTDGWITKMTVQGTVVWSKRYSIPTHNVVAFRGILPASDGTFFVTGTVSYLWPIDTIQYTRDHWGILLHIDNQGRVLSFTQLSARFNPFAEQTGLQSISTTKNGDYILSGVVTNEINYHSSQIIIKMDKKGKIKWTSTLSSNLFLFDFGLTKTMQLSNGNIIVAGLINQRSTGQVPKVGYYFCALDNSTGAAQWNNNYLFIDKPSSSYYATSESLRHIEELPGGDLSFVAYTTDASGLSNPPYTSTGINIITNNIGKLKKVIAYQNNQQGTYPVSTLSTGTGKQLLLIDDGKMAPLIQIDNNGNIEWLKGYSTGNTIAPVSLNSTGNGYYIFLNDRGPYGGSSYIMKLDAAASIDCKGDSPDLTGKDVTSLLIPEPYHA